MSKPSNITCWLFKCPKCNNNKLKGVKYKTYETYTCTKCNYKFRREIDKYE